MRWRCRLVLNLSQQWGFSFGFFDPLLIQKYCFYLSLANGDSKRIASLALGSIYSILTYWLRCGDAKHTICGYFFLVYLIRQKVFGGCIGWLSLRSSEKQRDFTYHSKFWFRFLLNIYLDYLCASFCWMISINESWIYVRCSPDVRFPAHQHSNIHKIITSNSNEENIQIN